MKRIVILCDGTWNRSDSETPTNVVRIAQAMKAVDPTGVPQIPLYIQGVGTGEGSTWLSRKSDKILGGAFGWGLMKNVTEAYRHLVFLYEPGDEIYIFGFSRGAFTARTLTGFIRSTGIMDRNGLSNIPKALDRYRDLGNTEGHPSSHESHVFRAEMSSRVVTSAKEAAWREGYGIEVGHLLRIAYLGVWDSVGALGVPRHIPIIGRLNERKYRFHDAELSSMVQSARHAVALDERRPSFEPTHWTNVEKLNAESDKPEERPYREQYFLGDHGSVGGGGDIRDLSSIALKWILDGAEASGLSFDARTKAAIEKEANPMGSLRNTVEPPGGAVNWLTRLRPRYRRGPARMSDLHPSVYVRWAYETKDDGYERYRPGSLAQVMPELEGHHADVLAGRDVEGRFFA